MSGFDVILALHLIAVAAAFFLSGILHTSEWLTRGCTTLAELRQVLRPMKLGPLFAPIILLLFGFGMALVGMSKDEDEVFHVSDPFAWTAIVVLAVLFLNGPLVMGRHAAKTGKALAEMGDGPVTPEARAMVTDAVVWMTGYANTATVIAVIYNMANKPSAAVCIADILGAAIVGALLGRAMASKARTPAG